MTQDREGTDQGLRGSKRTVFITGANDLALKQLSSPETKWKYGKVQRDKGLSILLEMEQGKQDKRTTSDA